MGLVFGGGEQNGNSQNEVNVCYRGCGEMENVLYFIFLLVIDL